MQKLRHPNIVHQQDMIESADGMLYIIVSAALRISYKLIVICCVSVVRFCLALWLVIQGLIRSPWA